MLLFIPSATEPLECIFHFSYNFYLIPSYIFCSSVKVLAVFIHSSPQIGKHLLEPLFNSLSGRLLISILLKFFFNVALPYSLVCNILYCLFILAVCLYVIGEIATFLNLE